MIRTTLMAQTFLAMSALALAALAAPASAEETIKVELAGKSTAQTYSAVVGAARTVCKLPTGAEIYSIYLGDSCVKDTVAVTLAKIASPVLSQYAANKAAEALTLARN